MNGIKTALIFMFFIIGGMSGVKCQVCGISGSKLNASCTGIIDHQSLEFEVLYVFEKSHSRWNHEGSLIPFTANGQHPSVSTDLIYRVTYGVFPEAEIGAAVDREANEASLGFKFMSATSGKISFAIAGGIRFSFGENSNRPEAYEESITKNGAIAFIYTHELTPAISIDLNAGYSIPLQSESGPSSGCIDICGDLGWYLFKDKLQVVIGAGLRSGSMDHEQDKFRLVTLYPGITVNTGRDYEIMIAIPRDIFGINHPRRSSVMCALTITLN